MFVVVELYVISYARSRAQQSYAIMQYIVQVPHFLYTTLYSFLDSSAQCTFIDFIIMRPL